MVWKGGLNEVKGKTLYDGKSKSPPGGWARKTGWYSAAVRTGLDESIIG